jgi:hypothetical protein
MVFSHIGPRGGDVVVTQQCEEGGKDADQTQGSLNFGDLASAPQVTEQVQGEKDPDAQNDQNCITD